jgi:hypothetical protein
VADKNQNPFQNDYFQFILSLQSRYRRNNDTLLWNKSFRKLIDFFMENGTLLFLTLSGVDGQVSQIFAISHSNWGHNWGQSKIKIKLII